MRSIAFILFAFNILLGYSQGNPKWVSEEYRNNYYPQESYLIGYGEKWDVSKKDAESTMNQLANIAKSDLIESVRVSVKSVSTSQLADYNGEITDFFKNQTESTSELNIVGLRTEKFYNKKEKKVFAFVYANKSEVARYYSDLIMKSRSMIEQGISQSKQLRSVNLIGSFSSLSEQIKAFSVIEDAQTVLLALGANTSVFLQKQEVNTLKTDFYKEITSVKKDPQMTIQVLSAIICEEITKIINTDKTLTISEFSYEETGMTSEFSHQLKVANEQSFIQNSKFTPADEGKYIIEGTFWVNGEYLEVKTRLRDLVNKKTLAFSNSFIVRESLDKINLVYIPKDIERLKMIPHLEFIKLTDNLNGKAGFGVDEELKVKVKYKGVAKEDIPVVFFNNNDNVVYCENSLTDKYGVAKCKVKTISGKYKNQIIKASIDLNNFVSVSKDNEYFQKTMGNKEIPSTSIRVSVVPSTVSIESSEFRFGVKSEVQLVEPEIKELLAGSGFKFTTDQANSDYVISIRSTSREGANLEGLHFAFVDVTISVYSNKEGKEIFKDSLVNYKGAGGSFDQAASKAFYTAAEDAKKKIEEVLLK